MAQRTPQDGHASQEASADEQAGAATGEMALPPFARVGRVWSPGIVHGEVCITTPFLLPGLSGYPAADHAAQRGNAPRLSNNLQGNFPIQLLGRFPYEWTGKQSSRVFPVRSHPVVLDWLVKSHIPHLQQLSVAQLLSEVARFAEHPH